MTKEWHIRMRVGFMLDLSEEAEGRAESEVYLRMPGAIMKTSNVRIKKVALWRT